MLWLFLVVDHPSKLNTLIKYVTYFGLGLKVKTNPLLTEAGLPLGEFVRANSEKSNLIGW